MTLGSRGCVRHAVWASQTPVAGLRLGLRQEGAVWLWWPELLAGETPRFVAAPCSGFDLTELSRKPVGGPGSDPSLALQRRPSIGICGFAPAFHQHKGEQNLVRSKYPAARRDITDLILRGPGILFDHVAVRTVGNDLQKRTGVSRSSTAYVHGGK